MATTYKYKDVDGLIKEGLIPEEKLENPNDPTDNDWDKSIDAYLNTIDPDLFREGKGSILDSIVTDVESNGGASIFFDDNYPRGIPYNKVSDERKKYAQNKINDLVSSKYHWLKEFL